MPGTVLAMNGYYDATFKNFTKSQDIPTGSIFYDSEMQFHVNIGNYNDTVIITYEYRANDGGKSSNYENAGKLTGDNIETHTIDSYTPNNGGGGNGDTSVVVKDEKSWDDNNNQDGKRPDSITVNLLANGKVVQTKNVTAGERWRYTFANLPKYENGKKIIYTITEDKVAEYETQVHKYDIVNHYNIAPVNPINPVSPRIPLNPLNTINSANYSAPKLSTTTTKQTDLPSTGIQSKAGLPIVVILFLGLTTITLFLYQKKHN